MADLTFSPKAPCVGGVSIWDPTTCTLLPDSYVFKFSGDTPVSPESQYFDDQDWTETASDGSQCGPVQVKRGAVKYDEVTIARCLTSVSMNAALAGSQARLITNAGDVTGVVATSNPSESLCTATPSPALFVWAAYPIGRCGSSGFCDTSGDRCVIEGWVWGVEPRVTTRPLTAGLGDPSSFSFWGYPIAADALAGLPANFSGLLTGGFKVGDRWFQNLIDCSLVPAPDCATVPTASLFVAAP